MKRRILSLLLVLTLLMALPVAVAAAGTKEVTLTLTQDTWTYTDTVTFSVKGPDGEDVPNGEVEVRSSMALVFCYVNNGVAEISASELVSGLELTLGQKTEISVNYTPGSGSDYAPKSGQTSITVNESTLPTVALTSAGYAYGAPVSGFSVKSATEHVSAGEVSIENDTDTTFGEKAYKVRLQLTTEKGYSLASDVAVTLDDKTGTSTGDGHYEFQLDELYPTYTITYELDGGTLSNAPAQYNKNSGTVTLPRPTRDGYRFTGWTGTDLTEKTLDVVIPAGSTGDRKYTANWVETRTVTFDVNGHGTAPDPQTVDIGTKAVKPTDPVQTGWRFDGWYTDRDCTAAYDFDKEVTEDITLYAKWVQTVTVTYHVGSYGTAPASQTVDAGKKFTRPADPVDSRAIFQGWYTDENYTTAYDFGSAVETDLNLYAKWKDGYRVVFQTAYGTAPAEQKVALNGKATKPADPTATGYIFKGWYTSQLYTAEFDFNTPIAADTTLYAKWNETYTVTFNVGGHGTAPTAQTVENGGKATKPENPTAKGWRFDGWYTDEKCTARYDFDKAVTANTTLYAKWTQLFTLTFETNGGTKIDSVEAPDGSLVYLGSYKPTKSGYYFVGWYTDKNLTRASRVGYVRMDGNKTVYAKFAVADKTNPKTADPALPGLALAVLSFSTVGLAAMGLKKRK